MAKLCALREKDQNFVTALLQADLVDAATITERLPSTRPGFMTPIGGMTHIR